MRFGWHSIVASGVGVNVNLGATDFVDSKAADRFTCSCQRPFVSHSSGRAEGREDMRFLRKYGVLERDDGVSRSDVEGREGEGNSGLILLDDAVSPTQPPTVADAVCRYGRGVVNQEAS